MNCMHCGKEILITGGCNCQYEKGKEIVSKPPWITGDVNTWVSDNNIYTCSTCVGLGYLII